MEKKTLLILCFLGDPCLPAVCAPNTGGYNVDIQELLTALEDSDWKCEVVTNTSTYCPDAVTVWNENIRVHRIYIEEEFLEQQEYLYSVSDRVIEDILTLFRENKIRPHLIHSFYWYSGYLAMNLVQKLNIPFVHSLVSLSKDKINSGIAPRSTKQTELEMMFLPTAHTIFAITEQEYNLVCNSYPVDPNRVLVVGRGVSKSFLLPQHDAAGNTAQLNISRENLHAAYSGVPDGGIWWNSGAFLFIGRLKEIKGIELIIQTWFELFQKYRSTVPPLWIVGGSPQEIYELRVKLKEQLPFIKQAEAEQKLVWWGYLSSEGISTLLLKALVLLMHSRFEAGGRVILEAMSSHVPVIATPTGFAADYIRNWENGFLVSYGNTTDLRQCMEFFISQPLLHNSMGNNAYQTYQHMQKQWNCYVRHLQTYHFACNHPQSILPRKIREMPILETSIDHVRYGFLTAYPFQSNFDSTQINRGMPFPSSSVRYYGLGIGASIWQIDNYPHAYIVKQFYTIMNHCALWSGTETPKVILANDRFCSAIFSSQNPAIIPILHKNEDTHVIMMPKYTPVPISQQEIEIVISLLSQFNLHPIDKQHMYQTCYHSIVDAWNSLKQDAKHTLCEPWRLFWDTNSFKLSACEKRFLSSTFPIRLNYGNSALSHLFSAGNNSFFLSPTDMCFWGDEGFDQARLWVTWCLKNGITAAEDLLKYYNKILHNSRISDKAYFGWCTCIVVEGIQRSYKVHSNDYILLSDFLKTLFEFVDDP